MTPITRYRCRDRSTWDTPEQALARDAVLDVLDRLTTTMPTVVDEGCRFANGHGYVQRSPGQVGAFIGILRDGIVLECGADSKAVEFFDKEPRGFVGRILDDGGCTSYRAWRRLCCIDAQGREWGQPYYALNPTQGDQVEWAGTPYIPTPLEG